MPTKEELEQELNRLRQEIIDCDRLSLEIFKRRLNIASQIGQIKRQTELPIMNSNREQEVLQKNIAFGKTLGLSKTLVQEFTDFYISKSKEIQQHDLMLASANKRKMAVRKSLIIGGCGQMGLWLNRYLQSLDIDRDVYDPSHPRKEILAQNFEFNLIDTIKDEDYEFVFITTPLHTTSQILDQVDTTFQKYNPLFVECGSIKSDVLTTYKKLKQKGRNLASIHPMFGPSKELSEFKNMLICEPEHSEEYKKMRQLFDHPSTQITSIEIEKHDRLMSYVLGLSHMSNLVFAQTISQSEFDFAFLREVSSTTFQNQINNVIPVVCENQDLYFAIQQSNPYSQDIIQQYQKQITEFLETITHNDREKFRSLMEKSKQYFTL